MRRERRAGRDERVSRRVVGWSASAAVVLLASCSTATTRPAPYEGTSEQAAAALVETTCDTDGFTALAESLALRTTAHMDSTEWGAVSAQSLPNSPVHDCQRLIVGGQLGPRVALLVAEGRVENGDFGSGVVVADVVNQDGPRYGPLSIEPGINCLWLRRIDVENWTAAIFQPSTGDCASAPPPQQGMPDLEVLPHTYSGSAYPSAGRWMWDASEERPEQFIGIRCGDTWCEIGRKGFRSSTIIQDSADVPGWYDEQFLSYLPPGGSQLQLSRLWGRIEPGQDLPSFNDSAFSAPDLEGHVATIRLTELGDAADARQAYARILRLPPALDAHELRLRRDKKFSFKKFKMVRRYRLKSPGSKWTEIERSLHTHAGRGAVRWAWSEYDEGTWMPCDIGCCKATQLRN